MKKAQILWLLALPLACYQVVGESVTLQQATATYSQSLSGDFSVAKAVDHTIWDGLGWGIQGQIGPQTAVFETSANVGFSEGSFITFTLTQAFIYWPQHTLGRFRLSVTQDDRNAFADGLAVNGDVSANWIVLRPHWLQTINGTTLERLDDDSILASGPNASTDTYSLTAGTFLTGITGVRLEVIPDNSLPFGGPGRQPLNGNFVLSEFEMNVMAVPEPSILSLGCVGGLIALGIRGGFRRGRK